MKKSAYWMSAIGKIFTNKKLLRTKLKIFTVREIYFLADL